MPIPTRTGYTKNYTGPAVPTKYDPAWQSYTNLTKDQIAAFQSFPQDLIKVARLKRWQKEISPLTVGNLTIDMSAESQRKIAGLKQAFDNGTLTGSVEFVTAAGPTKLDAAGVTAVYAAGVAQVQGSYAALATLLDAINTKTVTSRAQIDAAFEKEG